MFEDVKNKNFDHVYGLRLDTTLEKSKIGDSLMVIDGSDIFVKGKRYNSRQIVAKTRANKRYYRGSGQIAIGNKKYILVQSYGAIRLSTFVVSFSNSKLYRPCE